MTKEKYFELYTDSPFFTGMEETLWLCDILEKIILSNILEIGVAKAASMRVWEYLLHPNGLMVGVDICQDSAKYVQKLAEHSTKNIEFILGNSTSSNTMAKVKEYFPSQVIDFLFIDSDHTYETTEQEYLLYSPIVRSGGVIAFHDVYQRDESGKIQLGCGEFWQVLRGTPGVRFDEYVERNGIGVIYV